MSDDLSHDTHLRAALRHAPDHALAPPAGVSQAILNAARHVHKPARPAATPAPAVRITVAPPRALALLRQWFASPRLAGGLATGLVAALGLGLWLDLEREPVIDRTSAPAAVNSRSGDATSAAPGATATPATPAAPAAPTAPPAAEPGVAADSTRAAPAMPAPPATTEAPADAVRAKRPRSPEAKAERGPPAAPAARQAPTSPSPAPERREDGGATQEAEDALAKSAPAIAAAPAPATAPAPAAAVPGAANTTAPTSTPSPARSTAPAVAEVLSGAQKPAAQATAEAQREAAARSDSRMSRAAGRAATLAGARASAVDAAAAADTAASPAFALLRRARSEQAGGVARWTWLPPGKAAIVPLDAQAEAWLLRVAQASRGRWSDAIERSAPGDALEVRWWRDDWPQATLRIEADGLRWVEHSGRIHHAPLDAAALQRLRSP